MKKFDTRTYNVSDFLEWHAKGQLELSPKFQRKSVWTEKAKSYLIDTLVRGKPIPKILMTQTLLDGKNVRTVIDGQQRMRAVLDFYEGKFAISRAHNQEFAGKRYDDLSDDTKSDFLRYELSVDMIFDLSYEDTLDIFARLNTYSVKLNPQELLNAQYLGFFKQAAHALGLRYVRYWIEGGVLTEKQVTRMAEAELSSDLLGMLVEGIRAKRQIPSYFKKYDESEGLVNTHSLLFIDVMNYVGAIYPPEDLAGTNWSRVHFFNSLFCAIAHMRLGLKECDDIPRRDINESSIPELRFRLDEITARFDEVTNGADAPTPEFARFIEDARRATTDAKARRDRVAFICSQL